MISDNFNEKVSVEGTVSDLLYFADDCENCAVVDIDDECDPSSIFIHAKQDNVEFLMQMYDASGVDSLTTDRLRGEYGEAVANEISESFTDYFAGGKYSPYLYEITNDFDSSSNSSGFTVNSENFIYPSLTRLKNEKGYEQDISNDEIVYELTKTGAYIDDESQFSLTEYNDEIFFPKWSDLLGITYPKLTVFKQGDKDTQDYNYTYGVSQAWDQGNLSELNSIMSSANYSIKQDYFSITTNLEDEIQFYDVSASESTFNEDGVRAQGYEYESDLVSPVENSFEEFYSNGFIFADILYDNFT